MVLPSMPSRISRRHGQMPNDSGLGQGMCQKVRMVARGSLLADHRRQQREVVVLHQHDRVLAARLGHDGVGEALVDVAVVLPVAIRGTPAARARRGTAATGPRWRSRSSSPAPPRREPDAAQPVVVVAGRHRARGRARRPPRGRRCRCRARSRCRSRRASPARPRSPGRWPGAARRRRRRAALVDVGLAVGDHDDLVAAQLRAQQRAQPLGVPVGLGPCERRYSSSRSRRRCAQVGGERRELGRRRSRSGRSRPSPRSSARAPEHPAAPAQLGDDHRDQRDHQRRGRRSGPTR